MENYMQIKTKVHIMDCKLTLVVPQTIASTVYASLMKNQNQNTVHWQYPKPKPNRTYTKNIESNKCEFEN